MECTCFWVRDVPNPIAYDAERLLPNGAEGPLNELNDPGEDLEPVQEEVHAVQIVEPVHDVQIVDVRSEAPGAAPPLRRFRQSCG